jgi:chlorobactene glucosyltransferase
MMYAIVPLVFASCLTAIMSYKLTRAYNRFHRNTVSSHNETVLPSVSVCIAARNENHALAECLQRILASDYKKLEVIVYDDTSEDDTSMIVKSFAHLGVRFVEGSRLPEGWLGRNYAFDTLAREASGTYVLMTNVDTYIQPTTISQLVEYIGKENVDMVSVIPGRSSIWRNSVLFGVLYYYWQLVLSSASRPASSEALWMIRRRTLIEELGGLLMLKNQILIGRGVAKRLGSDRYRCLLNDEGLGVTWEKKVSTQRELSVRELYPLAGKSVGRALTAMVALGLLAWPPAGLAVALMGHDWMITVLYGLLELWLMSLYGIYTVHVWARWAWLGGIVWPVVIIQELSLLVLSTIRHLTNTVTWKGRSLYVK